MSYILDGKRVVLGTCYYPEHWPERLWADDLRRMLDCGIEVIRIAEFAWSKTEPEEGVFTYDFFDRFLDLCEAAGMKVIFGTPTATPPAWLTETYPEVLNADMEGHLFRHGGRRNYNYNAPVYRRLTERIVTRLAEHYARRPCVIGWQIDNELNCEASEFYSEADTAAFRAFLREKYGTLDALNEAWGTAFWNQAYTAWEQVYVPRPTASHSTNPHLALDYRRFVSASARSFCKLQSDILRRYLKPGDFITTNGLYDNLDNHRMTQESLDFFTDDSYPNFAYCLDTYRADDPGLRDRDTGRTLTEVRSASPVFGIMEQQSGANGWTNRMEAPSPRPGQMTLWTMQSIAHGADYVSYFRWRTSTIGTEIYWHGLLDYSGRDNRRIAELRRIHALTQKLAPVAGTCYQARVAIVKDYDNEWDARIDRWHERVASVSERALYAAAQRAHAPLDFVYLDHAGPEQLAGYRVLFCPHLAIMTPERAALLSAYVENGGTLVLGCRSAYKQMTGQCVMDRLPGLLAPLAGADVQEYTFISPDAGPVTIDWDGAALEASVFIELVEPAGGTREAVYKNDVYAGCGALVSHAFGRGRVYYYGTAFNEQAARTFLERLNEAEPWAHLLSLPESCELGLRGDGNRLYAFVLNYLNRPARIEIRRPLPDLTTGQTLSGTVEMPAYGVLVLQVTAG